MKCSFAEKISMLIDGELAESESRRMREHLADCAECRETERSFLFFREQIQESAAERIGEWQKTPVFPPVRKISFWRKGIRLPVPVLALLVLILLGLGFWLIALRFDRIEKTTLENPVNPTPGKTENKSNEISIARFDKGGRAEIYVAPRRAE